MHESFSSKFFTGKLRQKIAAKFGACPIQYKYLLHAEKMVANRAQSGNSFLTYGVNCLFCIAISAFYAFIPFFATIDLFSYTLLGITTSMLMVGLWSLPHFDLLLNPIHYPVVAHTPVSSRTYFLVKLTQVLTYTILLIASLNLLPTICGIWIREGESSGYQFFFPIVYLPISFMSGFFIIGVMTAFSGFLAKFYTKKKLRNIAQFAQFVFPVVFPVILLLLPRLSRDVTVEKLTSALKWFYALPNGWFAGAVLLALGKFQLHFLILASMAVVSTLILVMFPLRSIANSYSVYLSNLLESGHPRKSDWLKLRHKPKPDLLESGHPRKPEFIIQPPLLGRIFQKSSTRAGYYLGKFYLSRDRRVQLGLFVSIGIIGGVAFFSILDHGLDIFGTDLFDDSDTIRINPFFPLLYGLYGMFIIQGFLTAIRYSDHWKASWIFRVAPLASPNDLWRGVLGTTIFYIITPYSLLFACVAIVLRGPEGILDVLPGLVILLYYTIFFEKPKSRLPLSEETTGKIGDLKGIIPLAIRVICLFFATIILSVILFVVSLIFDSRIFLIFYTVIVGGGFIGFIYLYTKESDGTKPSKNLN